MHTSRAAARLFLPLALALPLAGCGGGGSSSSAPMSSPQSVSAAAPSGLTATLAEDKNAIRTGNGVNYTLTLTNNTAQPITLQSTLTYGTQVETIGGSVSVQDPSGGIVYPIQPPAISTGISSGPTTTLAPGKSVSGNVSPGNIFTKSGTYSTAAHFAFVLPTSTTPYADSSATVGPLTVNVQ